MLLLVISTQRIENVSLLSRVVSIQSLIPERRRTCDVNSVHCISFVAKERSNVAFSTNTPQNLCLL